MGDFYFVEIPSMQARDERGYTSAFVNGIEMPIELKHSGSYMLKQVIEYFFDIEVVIHDKSKPEAVSYAACEYALSRVGATLFTVKQQDVKREFDWRYAYVIYQDRSLIGRVITLNYEALKRFGITKEST